MSSLAPLDWIVIAVYGAVVVGIGFVANRKQKDPEDYFLGGRKLPWWVVGVSLVATSFSSVSLIGGTGFGYAKGMQWLQLQLGEIVALLVVAFVFLPFFSGMRITTAYEYLEHRFGVTARTAASTLFLGQTMLRAAILVYSPAIALSVVLGWNVETAIVVSAAAAILYSAFGGLGAVVWTDLVQLGVILFALAFCLAIVAGDVPGGMGAVIHRAAATGHLQVVTTEWQGSNLMTLTGAFVPYMVLALSLFGTNQQAVQRFLSVKDLGSARRVAVTGWTIGTFSLGFTLFLGACLSAWVALAPAAKGFAVEKGAEVLPAFLVARLPAGVAGLLLAAIFAASMSSLDSAIHSMSTASIVDFLRRFSRRTPSRRAELLTARFTTVACGVLATIGALLAADLHTTILETLVTWLGYVAGPLLGLFLLGMLTKQANETGALLGLAAGGVQVALSLALALPQRSGLHPLWIAPLSCVETFAVGWTLSLFFPPTAKRTSRGATPPAP